MILVTGGAGFIGSNLVHALNRTGNDVAVSDRLRCDGKWQNLADCRISDFISPPDLSGWLVNRKLDAIVHLGAMSRTDATDGDLVMAANFSLSLSLFNWCSAKAVPFIYASSAATYGDGEQGFSDDTAGLHDLRPLNLYGWSKHQFDLTVAGECGSFGPNHIPPQCVGLKFFNVYGPREQSKGSMMSLVSQRFASANIGNPVMLFEDGEQRRDFIFVDDVMNVIGWLLDHPTVSGLFNVGTGVARSFNDLMRALFAACGHAPSIEYLPMPDALRSRYQAFTEADMTRLWAAGYDRPFTPIEDGVKRTVEWLRARR